VQNFELIRCPTGEALARSVAVRWLSQLAASPPARGPHCVALSGGRIARKFFDAVVSVARTGPACLSKVHFFWADERCVPPTDSESNFGIARDLLLAPLEIQPDRIHRIRGEIPPDWAAAEAEAEICRIAELNGFGQPALDLIFLGMGEDGHVASLFPDAPAEVAACNAVYLPVSATKAPPLRISISYPAIAAAREVWVLASGAGKEAALAESLSTEGKTPLAKVLRQRERTVIFSDIEPGPAG
jgi:6-phosphogluconolactonase